MTCLIGVGVIVIWGIIMCIISSAYEKEKDHGGSDE